jgi:hypothetical protein
MRCCSRLALAVCVVFIAVVCTRADELAPDDAQPVSSAVEARLATVEPANRRVTVVPSGEVKLMELFVAAEGHVAEESRTLTLADLVIRVGRRVTVHFRIEGDRRIADRIIVQPD